jgi:hypothetical protein
MSNQTTSSKPTTPNPTNEPLPYAPRSPSPEEGELVKHPGYTHSTVISHDPLITEDITVADINGNPFPDVFPLTPTPIPIRLRASATAFFPSPPLNIPRSISPRTATALISHPTITLDEAKAIVSAIADNCLGKAATLHWLGKEGIDRAAAFEKVIQAAVDAREKAEERLKDLQQRVDELQGPECPDGFIENRGRIPHFHIPTAASQANMQARFVRQSPGNPTCVEGTMGGLGDPIYIIELHIQGRYNPDREPVPLSDWFTGLLAPKGKMFAHVLRAARETDDWGLVANLARYRTYSDRLADYDNTLRGIENARKAAYDRLVTTEARLACAQANQRLANLRALTDAQGAVRPAASTRIGLGHRRASNGRRRPF